MTLRAKTQELALLAAITKRQVTLTPDKVDLRSTIKTATILLYLKKREQRK